MRSFVFSALATLAFSVFCFAAPVAKDVSEIQLPSVSVARRDDAPSLVSILANVPGDFDALTAQIKAGGDLSSIFDQAAGTLKTAIDGIKGLPTVSAEKSFLATDTTTDVDSSVRAITPVVASVLYLVQGVFGLSLGKRFQFLSRLTQVFALLATLMNAILINLGPLANQAIAGIVSGIHSFIPTILGFLPFLGTVVLDFLSIFGIGI